MFRVDILVTKEDITSFCNSSSTTSSSSVSMASLPLDRYKVGEEIPWPALRLSLTELIKVVAIVVTCDPYQFSSGSSTSGNSSPPSHPLLQLPKQYDLIGGKSRRERRQYRYEIEKEAGSISQGPIRTEVMPRENYY